MNEFSTPPEWKKRWWGLKKTYVGKFGEKVAEEVFSPIGESRRITREFRNGSNREDRWDRNQVHLMTAFLYGHSSISRVRLSDEDQLIEFSFGELDPKTDHLVSLVYREGNFQSLQIRAEDAPRIHENNGDMLCYQQFLKIDEFSDSGIIGREISREWSYINPVQEMLVRKIASRYEKGIAIQDNKFSVTRDGNMARVSCTSINGRPRWTAIVPLLVPMDKISEVFKNTESDFRVLKDLVPASLKISQ